MIVGNDIIERSILVVTPQPEALTPIVAVIKTLLQQLPVIVELNKAISAAEAKAYDLIILDIHEGREGQALIHALKDRFPTVPLIAMVAYGNINLVEQVIAQGADDYISQPISLERLKTTLRNALRLRTLLASHGANSPAYPASFQNSRWLMDADGKWKTLREIEDAAIDHTIRNCGGCITKAARVLGVGRSTLYRKMQEKISARDQNARDSHTTRPMMAVSSAGES